MLWALRARDVVTWQLSGAEADGTSSAEVFLYHHKALLRAFDAFEIDVEVSGRWAEISLDADPQPSGRPSISWQASCECLV
jgi:hypothetical protein